MDSQLKKGLLEGCILAALQDEASYGYKIISDVSPYIAISESTLYPILKRLEAAACLRTYTQEFNGRLRKYYGITPLGKQRLMEFKRDMTDLAKISAFICGGKK